MPNFSQLPNYYGSVNLLPRDDGSAGGKSEHRGIQLLLTEVIMMSVAVLIVALRLFTRIHILGRLHSDDYWIMAASLCMIVLTVVHGVGIKKGIGKHIYDIPNKEDSDQALTMAYVGQLLYVGALGAVKISLLLFLQRVFPMKVMRRVVRGVLLFVLCFTVTNIFLFAFQCDNPKYYFSKLKGSAKADEGICLEPQVVYYPMAAINILTDIVIWILPVPTVLKARLSRREKWGLLWVFVLGGIAVSAAIVRPFNLREVMEHGDPTWQIVTVSAWAMIEVSVGIMCASIPAIKPLILRFAPHLLHPTRDSNSAITYRNGSPPHCDHHHRSRPHNNNNNTNGGDDFALRSIKVTKDVDFQIEEADAADFPPHQRRNGSAVPAGFGLGPPRVERHFEEESVVDVVLLGRKDTRDEDDDDEEGEGRRFGDMGSPSGSRGTGGNMSDENLVGTVNSGAFNVTAPLPAHRP